MAGDAESGAAIVVSTKVSQPRVARVVPRPRVGELIASAAEHPITWLHGGPGAGKTVAVAEFGRSLRPAPLWLQLDSADADVSVFFSGLASAAQRAWPRRRLSLPKLHPEQQIDVGPYARRFFAALVGRTSGPVFILDDYHHIPEQSPVHEAVVAGVEALGEGGRLIVASRKGPPPAFARARLAGTLAVIAPENLRFDRDELSALVALRKLDALPEAKLEAMYTLTDGWAAGLTLVLESGGLADREASEVRRETLFGYFMTEAVRGLDERTVHVLLSTACLRSIDVKLAQKLSGDDDAGEVLAALQRRALFVMRDASSNTSFRYHDLFRDFLVAECQRRMTLDAFRDLQVRSAKALLDAGETEEGADLLVRAEAWDELVDLILGGAAMVLFEGRFASLARWIDAMPSDVVAGSPWLAYWQGLSYLLSAPGSAREILSPALDAFAKADDDLGYCLAYSALAIAILAERHDMRHFDRLIDNLYERMDSGWTFPFDHAEAHVASAITIALAFRAPDHPHLERWRERARELEPLLPTSDLRAVAQLRIGLSALWSGDFVLAATCVDSMSELTPAGEEPSPFQTGAVISVEQYLRLYTEPAACRALRDRGLADAEHFGVSLWSPTLKLHDCAASLSLGHLDDASGALDAIAPEIQQSTRVERGYYAELRAWQALISGDPERALHHAEDAARIGTGYGARLPFLSSSYAIAVAAHEMGDRARAESLLDMLMDQGAAIRYLVFQTGVARAEIQLAAGDEATAIDTLRSSLALGRQIGCYNYFYWRNEAMTPLLCLALRDKLEVAFVQEMIKKHGITADVPPEIADRWPFALQIRTLGPLSVAGEKEAGVEPSGPLRGVRLRLLAELVAAPIAGVPLVRLADELWPDADGDRAMQSLHTTLHRLRKALGCDEAVVVDGGLARLDRRICSVDAWQLMDVASRGDASPQALEAAQALYNGPFLEGVKLDAGALDYRARLQRAVDEVASRR
jgi:ATP/maltotriose-dependent transcriptional regulator MalT